MFEEVIKKLSALADEYGYTVTNVKESDHGVEIHLERDTYYDNGEGLYGYVTIGFIIKLGNNSKAEIIPLVEGMTKDEFEKYVEEISDKILPPADNYYTMLDNIEEIVEYIERHGLATDEELKEIKALLEEYLKDPDNEEVSDALIDKVDTALERMPLELIDTTAWYNLVTMATEAVYDLPPGNEYGDFAADVEEILKNAGFEVVW